LPAAEVGKARLLFSPGKKKFFLFANTSDKDTIFGGLYKIPENNRFLSEFVGCLSMEARCELQRIIEIDYRIVFCFCSLDFTSNLTHSGAFNFMIFL
jgi:hypothetical protein